MNDEQRAALDAVTTALLLEHGAVSARLVATLMREEYGVVVTLQEIHAEWQRQFEKEKQRRSGRC
jgi:predicted transcriptional regulator